MTECYECARLAELVAENSALRVRVDELANGNDGETNVITSGSPLVDELPEGDAPSEFAEILMALAADCSCMGDGIVRHFEPKDVQGDVDALMRVVERDYVRRAVYDSLKELTTNSDKWLKGKLEEARAERDQWREAAGNAHEMWEQADTERNELKARVDELTAEIDALAYVGALGEQIGRCKACKFAGIHDGKRWPGREFKGRMYCVAWSDGYMAEWTKPDGFCHMWKPKEGDE